MSAAAIINSTTTGQACAYTWERWPENVRASVCALAGISDVAAIMNWYELSAVEKAALKPEILEMIRASAERQRHEWIEQRARLERLAQARRA